MYDIGTILKITAKSFEYPPNGTLTAMVIGYSYAEAEPKNTLLWYRENEFDGGVFGIISYTTYELATRAEVCGKCDIGTFIDETSHLKNVFAFLEKRAESMEEALDSIHRNKRDISEQITKLHKN